MIASLPSSLSISQPVLTYLTTQAHRREIKSRETLIALANVTGQEVTDNTHTHALCTLYSCNNAAHMDLRALLGAFINLNVLHMKADKNDQLVTSGSNLSLYWEKWSGGEGQLAERMSSA